MKRIAVRPPVVRLYDDEVIVDNFAGGGGASEGLTWAFGKSPDHALNHSLHACAMHKINHPDTKHHVTDVLEADPVEVTDGKPIGCAWFSPDCTEFSKAKNGKPFRDPRKTRRTRGLAWVVVKYARAPLPVKPRVIFVENVEEFRLWGAIGKDGRPDRKKMGRNFRRWKRAIEKEGYVLEYRELRGMHVGAPTSRKRLFIVARRDGKPIVWPAITHGPKAMAPVRAWDPHPVRTNRYRTAADCIDFSIPVPSIFMSPAEAREWARLHGCGIPKRPLADNTLRRIARGMFQFVIKNPQPFVIEYNGPDLGRHQVPPSYLVNVRHDDDRVYSVDDPVRTIPASDREIALVTPFLTEHANASNQRNLPADEPMRTICANVKGGHFALVAPSLIQVGYGEREGQQPRTLDLFEPLGTVVGGGGKHALVAAFLAKHNGGHEATGQRIDTPTDTVMSVDQKALVTSSLVKLYGSCRHGAEVTAPMPTVTADGSHIAEVRAFLVKFYGSRKSGNQLAFPLDTVTTVDRFGLVIVTIAGQPYVIWDIGMRMLTPRELYRAQGFLDSYVIDHGMHPTAGYLIPFTKRTQTRLCGNSVPPYFSAALAEANFADGNLMEAIA